MKLPFLDTAVFPEPDRAEWHLPLDLVTTRVLEVGIIFAESSSVPVCMRFLVERGPKSAPQFIIFGSKPEFQMPQGFEFEPRDPDGVVLHANAKHLANRTVGCNTIFPAEKYKIFTLRATRYQRSAMLRFCLNSNLRVGRVSGHPASNVANVLALFHWFDPGLWASLSSENNMGATELTAKVDRLLIDEFHSSELSKVASVVEYQLAGEHWVRRVFKRKTCRHLLGSMALSPRMHGARAL